MSALISLDSISYQAGNKQLFNDLKLIIADNSRLAIIGPNGSGKSTLMKIIAGNLLADQGRVIKASGIKIAYITQLDNFDQKQTVLTLTVQELKKQFSDHEAEIKANKYLTQVGFTDFNQKILELSGGWRKRLAIAIALACEPQLLLLDEPSNHLDLVGLLWLENLLIKANFAWVLISHDRYFLERTVNEVVEISPRYKNGVLKFSGSYNAFIEKRKNYLEQEERSTNALLNKFKTETDWASRSPKARTTKASHRLKEVEKLGNELQERSSRVEKNNAKISFTDSSRQTKDLVELINVSFGFGDQALIKKLNLTIKSGICLGILGSNGQGKSTLLKLIGGELSPSSGKVKQAAFLKVVYFDQLRTSLKSAKTLNEAISDGSDQVVYQGKALHVITWGKRFGFEPSDLEKSLDSLSGGEQARVLLSNLVRQEADLLILDEPTNDLDIPMLETLETMLMEFSGAVILVTHDRFILEKVCTNYLGFSLTGDLATYSSYQQWESARQVVEQVAIKKDPKPLNTSKGKTRSFAEQKELNQIEKKIIKAEQRLEEIQVKASNPNIYLEAATSRQILEELKQATAEVEKLYERWQELES